MRYIKNWEALLATGEVALRRLAIEIAEAGIASADPGLAARRHVSLTGETLYIGEQKFDLSQGRRIFVIGAGKASYPIAKVLDEVIGDRIYKGLVTCKDGQKGDCDFIDLHFASHPIPNRASLEAAVKTAALLREVRPSDIVLACFTGGSSSLFVHPVEGVSLDEKAISSEILLTCGANIVEINAVRKHLSRVKGGKLVQSLPSGTHLINLTVSDVIGDRLDCITDPSVPDCSTFTSARATLDKYDLWSRLPKSVAEYIRSAPKSKETMRVEDLSHLNRTDILLVAANAACAGAAEAAHRLGIKPLLLSTFFEGESSALGRNLIAIAKQVVLDGNPTSSPCVLIAGGETTVIVNGSTGQGGPNQEFAVGAAIELAGARGIVAVGLDTDGTDGPTNYAGGLVDGLTVEIAEKMGVDFHAALRRHDVTPSLIDTGHIVITGATGTNVNDLKLVLIDP